MRLTRYTDYALRVLIHLGAQPDRICSIAEIARGYGISQNLYLAKLARTTHYETTFTFNADGSASYTEHTMLEMAELPKPLDHADSNRLVRVD